MKIITGIYSANPDFCAWIEPADRSWIVFVRHDGTPVFFGAREPQTGAVL